MGQPQSVFLEEFKAAFHRQIDAGIIWSGGQGKENTAGFAKPFGCRRNNGKLKAERFKLGDLARIKADPGRLFAVEGRQFDHWEQDADRRAASISDTIAWIDQTVRA